MGADVWDVCEWVQMCGMCVSGCRCVGCVWVDADVWDVCEWVQMCGMCVGGCRCVGCV